MGRYDAALRRLAEAARSLPPADRRDQKIAMLSALPPAPATVGAALPAADFALEGTRLRNIQRSLLDGLRSRREMARADQIASQQAGWLRAAQQQYPISMGKAVIQPDLDIQLLQANVETLTRTLEGWKTSTPPAPKWEALRLKVEAEHARLQNLIAVRVQLQGTLQARQEAEGRHLAEARAAYVQIQAGALESRLRESDERFLADQQGRLMRQRIALFGALALPNPVSVPAAGNAGVQTLPKGRGVTQAALAGKSLAEAEAHLDTQKARWVRHLYDDTKAAAQDTAGQRDWDVTFGPPRPGDQDLTQPMALAMRAGVWRL